MKQTHDLPTVTAADRETAERIFRDRYPDAGLILPPATIEMIAAALAEQRERLVAAHVADLERMRSGSPITVRRFCRERIAELKGE